MATAPLDAKVAAAEAPAAAMATAAAVALAANAAAVVPPEAGTSDAAAMPSVPVSVPAVDVPLA